MSIKVGNGTYYCFSEVCDLAGISRSTLLRWMKPGTLGKTTKRDRHKWKLFSERDVAKIWREACSVRR